MLDVPLIVAGLLKEWWDVAVGIVGTGERGTVNVLDDVGGLLSG